MAHLTNKKREQRRKNNLNRAFNPMNMGTRDMGYKSNNERKIASKTFTRREELKNA